MVAVAVDRVADREVRQVGGPEALTGPDDVLRGLPVGVPANLHVVGQVVLGDLEQGFQQARLDKLVAIREQGMGNPEGKQVIPSGLAVLDLPVPLTNNDRRPCLLRDLGGALPVAGVTEEGNAVDEDVGGDTTPEGLYGGIQVPVIVMSDKERGNL